MKLVAVIVTHNGSKWIEKSISSVIQTEMPVQVVVVDNNSSDNTLEIVRSRFPQAVIFQNSENFGFGKANNIGIKYALEINAELIFLLNQDAWVEAGAIKKLVEQTLKYPGYILSPVHLNCDGSKLDYGFASYVSHLSTKHIFENIIEKKNIEEVYEADFVNAAFWLIPINVIKKTGGFDPLFFQYEEDVDFINRAHFHGFRIGICSNAVGYHCRKQNRSNSKNNFSYKSRIRKRNVFLAVLKNINKNFFGCAFSLLIYFLKTNAQSVVRLDLKSFLTDYIVLAQVLLKLRVVMRHRKINKTSMRSFL